MKGLELTIERFYQTHSHNIHFKITRLVRRFSRRRNLSSSRIRCCYIILTKTSESHSVVTLCNSMDCSMAAFAVIHHLQELAQTHVRGVTASIQLSHPLSSPSPLAFNNSQNEGLFSCAGSLHQVAKALEFQHQTF